MSISKETETVSSATIILVRFKDPWN